MIQFIFHTLLSIRTRDIVHEIDRCVLRQGQGKDGQHETPEICPHRMMNEILIFSKEPLKRQWFNCKDDDGSHQFSQQLLFCFRHLWISCQDQWDWPWQSTKWNFSCSHSNSLGVRHSVSTLCSWQCLPLCSDSGGEPLSKSVTLLKTLGMQTTKDRRQRETAVYRFNR